MTIATTTSRVDVLGNGSATVFSFAPVVIFSASDLQVTLRDSAGNETALSQGAGSTNYSVNVASYPGTGSITYPASGGSPLPSGSSLTIKRIVALLQSVALENQGAYFANVQEGAFDYLTAIDQQQQEQINRTVQVAATDPAVPVTLPSSAVRANKLLGFDSSGTPIAALAADTALVSTAMQPFVDAASVPAATALLQYTLPTTGAATRNLVARLGDVLNLKDFGAVGDGVADDTAHVNAWIAAVLASGAEGYAPAGTYKCTSQISIDWGLARTHGVTFRGAGINRALFDLSTVATAPAWLMTSSTGAQGCFYGVFDGIGILANCPGAALQWGLGDNTVAFNSFRINTQVKNNNATSSAIGMLLDGVYNCDIFAVSNCNKYGVALYCQELQFSKVIGSFSGADIGIYLTSYYNFGNVFASTDQEVVNTCVKIDNAQSTKNTFLGGQFVCTNGLGPSVACINATAGANNRFIGCNFNGTVYTGSTGIIIYGNNGVGAEIFGAVTISPPTGDGAISIDSTAPSSDDIVLKQAGVTRWQIQRDTSANLKVQRFNSSGVLVDALITLDQGTGVTSVTQLQANGVGFFGAGVTTSKPAVTGSRASGAAFTSLIGVLSALGLITDSTVA